ncbi:SDR family NAD(P)-dependent oxidoreductase [Streptosporangium lutulentum]
MSVWFVTGASRGLGAEIVREALSRGRQVVAAVRDAEAARKEFQDAGANSSSSRWTSPTSARPTRP